MKINNVIAENAVEKSDVIYFPILNGNSLYSFDLKSQKSKRLCSLMQGSHPLPHFRLCEAITVLDNKIVFASSHGDACVGIYNIEREAVEWLDVSSLVARGVEKEVPFKFCQCIPYGEFVYAIGAQYPAILKINVRDNSVSVVAKYEGESDFYFLGSVTRDNLIYLPYAGESKVMVLNMKDEAVRDITIEEKYPGFSGIAYDDKTKSFFLHVIDSELVVKCNENGQVIEEFAVSHLSNEDRQAPFYENMTETANGFLLFPISADHVMEFDYEKEAFGILDITEDILKSSRQDGYKGGRSVFSFATNGKIWLIETCTKKWHEICLQNRSVTSYFVNQATNGIIDSWRRGVTESADCNIEDFVKILSL